MAVSLTYPSFPSPFTRSNPLIHHISCNGASHRVRPVLYVKFSLSFSRHRSLTACTCIAYPYSKPVPPEQPNHIIAPIPVRANCYLPWLEEAIAVEEGAACACSHVQLLTELLLMLMSSVALDQPLPAAAVNNSSHPHPLSSLAMEPHTRPMVPLQFTQPSIIVSWLQSCHRGANTENSALGNLVPPKRRNGRETMEVMLSLVDVFSPLLSMMCLIILSAHRKMWKPSPAFLQSLSQSRKPSKTTVSRLSKKVA